MKLAHRPDIFGYSRYDEARDLDFHSWLLVRPNGNVLIDPLPLTPHDEAHLQKLGGVAWIVVTNSDHLRDAAAIAERLGAKTAGPAAEHDAFGIACDRWLADGEDLVDGIRVLTFDGSKTPGELALLIDDETLVCGDLLRAHAGGRLDLLPDPKLTDRARAIASAQRLLSLPKLTAILVGDGWPTFRDAPARLRELLARLG